jgi:two-component system chemotaxis sensor kinase CheA
VGFPDVAEFTHLLENLVLKLKEGQIALGPKNVTTLLKSNDRLTQMLRGLQGDLDARFQNDDLIAEIQAWLDPAAPEEETPAASDTRFEEVQEEENPFFSGDLPAEPAPALSLVPEVEAPILAPSPSPAKTAPSGHAPEKDELVRVSLSKIEGLNHYVGELIILQSVLQQQSMDAQNPLLSASVHQISKLSKEIQELAMSLRMFPIKPIFQKLNRVVRDTSQAVGKEVSFETQGENLELDKSVIDHLGDPLVHILRNAVDHGLEAT